MARGLDVLGDLAPGGRRGDTRGPGGVPKFREQKFNAVADFPKDDRGVFFIPEKAKHNWAPSMTPIGPPGNRRTEIAGVPTRLISQWEVEHPRIIRNRLLAAGGVAGTLLVAALIVPNLGGGSPNIRLQPTTTTEAQGSPSSTPGTEALAPTTIVATTSPSVASTAPGTTVASGIPTLQEGMRGSSAVKKLQEELSAVRCDVGPDGADGNYGPDTVRAVTSFEQAAGFVADGIADPAMQRALESAAAAGVPACGQ